MKLHTQIVTMKNHILKNRPLKKLSGKIQVGSMFIHLLLILLTIMVVSLCFQKTINYDEYYSLQWCRLGWEGLIKKLISDVHPPLYYFLLKLILDFTNENMFCARALSAASGIMLLWSGTIFLSRHFGKKSALFYVCFLYLNPFMFLKATEIRMYMLASMFTVISGICSYYILKGAGYSENNEADATARQTQRPSGKYWFCFTLSSILTAYMHYYALLVMCFLYAGIAAYFICTRNKKEFNVWLVCAVCTVIAYLPWLNIAFKQVTAVNQAYWISAPTSRLAPLRELFYSAVPYSEHIYLGTIMLLIMVAFIQFVKAKKIDSYWTLVCSSALCGIMLFAIWYASRFRPILVSRYLIMAVCLCIIGISSMVRFLNKYIVIFLCLFCFPVGGICYLSTFCAQAEVDRITTKTVDFIDGNGNSNDCIVYVHDGYGYIAHCVEYYFPDMESIGLEKEELPRLEEIILKTDDSVWFLDDNEYMNDTQMNVMDYIIDDCGIYGFGSADFNIYELRKCSAE